MKYRDVMVAAAFSLAFAGTTVAAEDNIATPTSQPGAEQEQTPGLQQTPSGEPMKTARDKDAPKPSGSTPPSSSTGPTFPNGPAPK
jgi:hypothetical protein